MAKIILSDEQRDELLRTGSVIELYDAQGRRVGTTYVTAPEPTREQLDASFNGPGNYTTAEVLAYARERVGQ